jgi:hypothetical protein
MQWWQIISGALIILTTIATGALIPLGIHLDNKIENKTDAIRQDVQSMSKRQEKDEAAIKTLSSEQTDKVQKLIEQLLSMANTINNPGIRTKATQLAASLVVGLKEEKKSSNPQFFEGATVQLAALHKTGTKEEKLQAFQVQQQLAEYQSALQTVREHGFTFDCGTPKGRFAIGTQKGSTNTLQNFTITNCSQVLDDLRWRHVIFVNSIIIYRGGPVVLDDVVFINCKFEVQRDDDGFQVLQYATVNQNQLGIKTDAFKNLPS